MITRKPFMEPSEFSYLWQGAQADRGSASVAIISMLGRGGTAVLIASVILAVALSVAAFVRAQANADLIELQRETVAAQKDALEARISKAQAEAAKAQTEAELLEYYVLSTDNKFVTRGYLKPEETWSAQKGKR